MPNQQITKIKIIGKGGQGIKSATMIAGNILNSIQDKYISITYNYDAAVRGATIEADFICSSKKIINTFINEADIYLQFVPVDKKNKANKIIELFGIEDIVNKEIGDKKMARAVIIGLILKFCGFDSAKIKENIKKLKKIDKLSEEEIKAIIFGNQYEI